MFSHSDGLPARVHFHAAWIARTVQQESFRHEKLSTASTELKCSDACRLDEFGSQLGF